MECDAFRDEMLEVLYGEADGPTRRRFEEHREGCPACRDEVAALARLRRDLMAWTLPADLQPRRAAIGARSWAAGLAAAAAVLLALSGGLALTGSEVSYDQGRLAFRLGRPAASSAGTDLERRLSAQEARHLQELEALRAALAQVQDRREAVLLERVSELIRESEARQAVLVSATVGQLREHTEAQRRYDLAQVGAGLSYLEGKAGLQVARTTELMGHVLQATQKR